MYVYMYYSNIPITVFNTGVKMYAEMRVGTELIDPGKEACLKLLLLLSGFKPVALGS